MDAWVGGRMMVGWMDGWGGGLMDEWRDDGDSNSVLSGLEQPKQFQQQLQQLLQQQQRADQAQCLFHDSIPSAASSAELRADSSFSPNSKVWYEMTQMGNSNIRKESAGVSV